MGNYQACFCVMALLGSSSGFAYAEVSTTPLNQESERKGGSSGLMGQDPTTSDGTSSRNTGGSSGSTQPDRKHSGNIGPPDQPKAAGEGTLSGPGRLPDANRGTAGKGASREGQKGSGPNSTESGGRGSSGGTASPGSTGGGY